MRCFFIKKVLIIFGGNSPEHYVSCKSCKSVAQNIDNNVYDYRLVGIDFDNKWYEYDDDLNYLTIGNWKERNVKRIHNVINYLKSFDIIFPMIHGPNGEDGRLQGMLELFNIKYVGCGTFSSSAMMDKEYSKILFKSLGIKVVPYHVGSNNTNLKYPLIVKPANGGSSIGISKINNEKELPRAINEARKYDHKIIMEEFIKARELEVAVLEDKNDLICSKPGEIKSSNEFYDYNAKYENRRTTTLIPNDLSEEIINKLKIISKNIFINLGLKGYARIDYFYDIEKNEIYINEVNTIPGFTEISMYPELIKNEGISYKRLISILIENATNHKI